MEHRARKRLASVLETVLVRLDKTQQQLQVLMESSSSMSHRFDRTSHTLDNQILNLLGECTDVAGLNISTIGATLQARDILCLEQDVRERIHFLLQEGHIFTTISEDFIKLTY
eukprot:c8758_g1_i2.p3 GENE.c8758_g1_i2~~c8758_g1_i2.p3  ORF type:complete len:113 (-),score=34.89 c8758_g1_i2:185-523(-)